MSARPAAQNGGCRAAPDVTKAHDIAPSRSRGLVAGAGAFGKEHLSRLTKRPDVKVTGVADTNPAALAVLDGNLYGDTTNRIGGWPQATATAAEPLNLAQGGNQGWTRHCSNSDRSAS